jgi:hypothetical protein
MSYRDFTLPEVKKRFHLVTDESTDFYAGVSEKPVSSLLAETLAENVPLALAIHTEKARSELIVTPMLVELRKLCQRRISLFSGTELDVDAEQGLTGVCDYVVTRSTEQLYITAPVLTVFEAKRDSIKEGLGQCAAAMVGARLFNQREETGITVIHGIVTTGSIWQALRLEGQTIWIDRREYYIEQPGRILGILFQMVAGKDGTALGLDQGTKAVATQN